jgi:hypothetical protein
VVRVLRPLRSVLHIVLVVVHEVQEELDGREERLTLNTNVDVVLGLLGLAGISIGLREGVCVTWCVSCVTLVNAVVLAGCDSVVRPSTLVVTSM